MKILMTLVFLIVSFSTALAENCPSAHPEDRNNTFKLDLAFSLLSKFISSIGIKPEVVLETKQKVPQSDEYFLKTSIFASACQIVSEDPNKTSDQKNKDLQQWFLLIFRPPSAIQAPQTSGAQPPIVQQAAAPPESSKDLVRSAVLHAPMKLRSSSTPTIRVFLKSNLKVSGVAALQAALPEYDVRIGKSAIDPSNSADTLIVNRGLVSESSVLRVISALREQAVFIKSVQQAAILRGRNELQVGTFVGPDNGPQEFGDTEPLNISKLSALHGAHFWKTAFNGKAFCLTQIGFSQRCSISDDGTPVQ